MTHPAPISGFEDLPRRTGRHEIFARIGAGTWARKLPVWWQRGRSLRPCLAVTAAVHGDEFEGFVAVREFWETLRHCKIDGSVLIVPVCNPWASERATRCTPPEIDGANLARSFPGSRRGGPTSALAAAIWKLVSGADVLVDLHSGGTGYDYLPAAGFYTPADIELASCFPTPFLWRIPENAGVLSYEMHRAGKRTIGCEWGGSARLDWRGSNGYLDGLMRLLRYLRIAQPALARRRTTVPPILDRTQRQVTRACGWFFATVEVGQHVQRGDSIGLWITQQGRQRKVRSDGAGIIFAIRTLPRVQAGDYLILTARCRNQPMRSRSRRGPSRV